MFFSWNTHPLVSFTFQFTYVVLFVLVLHRMQLSQSLLPKVIRNAGSPSDRADGAHSPLLSKQSKKPKKKKKTKSPTSWCGTNLGFKTLWTSPASNTLMENFTNLLLLNPASNVLPNIYLWITTIGGRTMKLIGESSILERRDLPHQTHNSTYVCASMCARDPIN